MSKKISEQDFFKSLEALETMAEIQKSQICTGPNSKVESWPGGDSDEIDDKYDDNINGGTDYNGPNAKAKIRKSIAEKVMKGQPLTTQEVALLKSDCDKAAPMGGGMGGAGKPAMPMAKSDDKDADDKDGDKDKKDKKDDDKKDVPFFAQGKDKDDEKMGKSMAEAILANDTLRQGIEVSDFLAEFAKSFAYGLEGMEARLAQNVTGHVLTALGQMAENQGQFNKSLAEAISNIGHGVAGGLSAFQAQQDAPAHAPKSHQVLSKGSENRLEGMSKAQVADKLTDLVIKGQLSPIEVSKYEMTNQLSPVVQDMLVKSLG